MKTTSSEIDLFNHEEFGEAYLGMAFHVRNMSQLDRIIFEDCTVADGAVVAPHLNVKSRCPVHLRPEILQKRIGCTFHQAVSLADAWSIVEATAKMVNEFIVGIKAKGIEESIAYFERLAMELAEVEVSWDHDAAEQLHDDVDDGPDDPFNPSGESDDADGSHRRRSVYQPEQRPRGNRKSSQGERHAKGDFPLPASPARDGKPYTGNQEGEHQESSRLREHPRRYDDGERQNGTGRARPRAATAQARNRYPQSGNEHERPKRPVSPLRLEPGGYWSG